jgi:O-antigen ligase
MYAVLIGMPLLAVAMGPRFKGSHLVLFGFLTCAVIVQCTLSRAALAIFGAGTLAVLGLSLLEKITPRRLLTTGIMGVLGAAGLLLTLDTILARFNDHGNEASSELRDVMKDACREMAKDHPLGIGWNNYALAVNPPYRYSEIYYDWTRSRNMRVDESKPNSVVESHYYLLLAENGYPGLFSWLALIGVGLWRNVRAFFFFGHSFARCLSLGIAMGCALNYAQSTLERVLTQPRNLMLWLILLAITGRLEVMRRNEKNSRKARAGTKP